MQCQKHAPLHASNGPVSSALITTARLPRPLRRPALCTPTRCTPPVSTCYSVGLYRRDLAQILAVALCCTQRGRIADHDRLRGAATHPRQPQPAESASRSLSGQPTHAATVGLQDEPLIVGQSVCRLRGENILLYTRPRPANGNAPAAHQAHQAALDPRPGTPCMLHHPWFPLT